MIFFSNIAQTFRSLKANRTYNIINILGLALGLASTFILLKFVLHELNTDKFHNNYDRICYLSDQTNPQSIPRISSSRGWVANKPSEFPEIDCRTDIVYDPKLEVKVGENIFNLSLVEVDSLFPKIFDFPLKSGSYDNIFSNPNGIIISEDLSEKVFGKTESMGQKMEFRGQLFTVVGIMDEFPGNSTLQVEAMIQHIIRGLYFHPNAEFILLKENVDLQALNKKILEEIRSNPRNAQKVTEFKPFSQLHFHQNGASFFDVMEFGKINSVKILLLIAILLFAVSTFNYLNIYQVILQKRSKEIGILAIHGGGRKFLAALFLRENIVSVGISAFLVILLYSLLSSYAPVVLDFSLPVYPVGDLLLLLAISIVLIIITSSITAIRYRRINPLFYIKVLSTGKRAFLWRRISMSLQYTVTIALIIVSIFFVKQLNFMLNQELGFKQKNIICSPFFSRLKYDSSRINTEEEEEAYRKSFKQNIETQESNMQFVRDEIIRNPFLSNHNYGDSPLSNASMPWKLANSDQESITTFGHFLTPNYKELYDLHMIEGRFFDRNKDKDRELKVVINQSAKQHFNIEDISSAYLANQSWGGDKEPWKVIGVVEDFSFEHLSREVKPLLMFFFDDKEDKDLMVEIAEGKETESIEFLRNLFEEVNPGKVFTYHLLEDDVKLLYQEDKKVVRIYGIFTIIALIICSLGLFSFSIYDVQQRFKEIGIRKANGSGVWETVFYLTKNVFILLGIAFIIAVPISWFAISKYLEGFANKAPLSWWIFVLAAFFTLIISVLTVIAQSYRAATRNPVDALRYE